MAPGHKGPAKVTDLVRIEARWAPKDFHALKSFTAQMYIRLAPLLSTFNTSHSWVIEWQTDQLAPGTDHLPCPAIAFAQHSDGDGSCATMFLL